MIRSTRAGVGRALAKTTVFSLTVAIVAFILPAVVFAGGQKEQKATQIQVSSQPRVYISPKNAQAGNNVVKLQSSVLPGTNRVIKSYEMDVYNSSGVQVWSKSETQTANRGFFGNLFNVGQIPQIPPATIEDLAWSGVDQQGNYVPDGDYIYQLTVTDNTGATAKTPPLNVTVDNTPPTINKVAADYTIFSPNGDGIRDTVPISQSGSVEVSWVGVFKDSSGNAVRTIKWQNPVQYDPKSPTVQDTSKDVPPPDFSWDGKDDNGNVVPDGDYTYVLTGTDRAQNSTASQPLKITVSTKAGALAITVDNPAFSPNGDGVKDTARFTTRVSEPVGLSTWKLIVATPNKPDRALRTFSGGANIPATIDFDGKDDSGLSLPDGKYVAYLTAEYVNGNQAQSEPLDLTIDTKAPQATISANPLVFGGTGKETTALNVNADFSYDWIAEIQYPGGQMSQSLKDLGISAADFPYTWSGKDLQGNELPDGKYTIYLHATDAAGNTGESNHLSVVKLTEKTPISLSLSSDVFSPNGDGVKDTVTINTNTAVKDYIDQFLLYIKNSDGRVVRSEEVRQASDSFTWDGKTNAGTALPDGKYTVDFEVQYQNGNDEKASAGPITLDTVAPRVTASVDNPVFSPNGDGIRDTATITQSSESGYTWTAAITDSKGNVVRSYSWPDQVQNFTWDGNDSSGKVVPDGDYLYKVQATDAAGNTGSATLPIRVDTLSAKIDIQPEAAGFSPNGDGKFDTLGFTITLAQTANVKDWSVAFVNSSGTTVRTITGGTVVPGHVVWDGKTDVGVIIDGTYTAQLTVDYTSGVYAQNKSKPFALDTTAPTATVTVAPVPFSPDGDGINDTVTIGMSATAKFGSIASWTLDILDPMGNSFIKFDGSGSPPPSITWDGKSRSGELVQSGLDYSAVLSVTDSLDNSGSGGATIAVDILVIKVGNTYHINVPNIYFAPFSWNLLDVEPSLLIKDLETLRKLGKVLQKYDKYDILIRGHAVSLLYYNKQLMDEEQQQTLIPLSRDRAREVMLGLAILGIDMNRMSVEGVGAAEPIVPFSDIENRWKDRRVEFILKNPRQY